MHWKTETKNFNNFKIIIKFFFLLRFVNQIAYVVSMVIVIANRNVPMVVTVIMILHIQQILYDA